MEPPQTSGPTNAPAWCFVPGAKIVPRGHFSGIKNSLSGKGPPVFSLPRRGSFDEYDEDAPREKKTPFSPVGGVIIRRGKKDWSKDFMLPSWGGVPQHSSWGRGAWVGKILCAGIK